MNTPITPLRMPLVLKDAAKKKAKQSGFKNLSSYIYKLIKNDLNQKS